MPTKAKADEVFFAWQANDFERMIRAMALRTNPINRHYLLMGIVREACNRRADPAMRKFCVEIAELHLSELPELAPALAYNQSLPTIETFSDYLRILYEDGNLVRAAEIRSFATNYEHDLERTHIRFRKKAEALNKPMEA